MPNGIPLTAVSVGQTGVVETIEGGRHLHDRLRALGIRPGSQITKISGAFWNGPIVVQHGRAQTALGNGICQKIIVEVPG